MVGVISVNMSDAIYDTLTKTHGQGRAIFLDTEKKDVMLGLHDSDEHVRCTAYV